MDVLRDGKCQRCDELDSQSNNSLSQQQRPTTETANPKKSRAFKSNNTQPLVKATNPDNRPTKAKSKHKVDQTNSINQDSKPKYLTLKMTNMKEEVTITNV